jgi:hypothetical protein
VLTAKHVFLLAQDTARYNRGLAFFQWGLTLFGFGLLVVAAGVLFQKPKEEGRELSRTTRQIVAGVLAVVGVGIMGYAWLGFSSL